MSHDLFVNIPENILNRVLSNIIDNSIQSIEKNGVIQINVFSSVDSTIIYIKDTGYGIAPENLKYVFNKGFSLKPNGRGLGLQHAKEMIEKHRGKIEIESIIGHGTTININIQTN